MQEGSTHKGWTLFLQKDLKRIIKYRAEDFGVTPSVFVNEILAKVMNAMAEDDPNKSKIIPLDLGIRYEMYLEFEYVMKKLEDEE